MNDTLPGKYIVNQRFKLLSIIIPTSQEAENLRPLITCIATVMDPCHIPYEVIVVDDDSQDGSIEIIDRIAKETSSYPAKHFVTQEEAEAWLDSDEM